MQNYFLKVSGKATNIRIVSAFSIHTDTPKFMHIKAYLHVNHMEYYGLLTFTTLWTIQKTNCYFLNFPRKQDLTLHANCVHWKQFVWNIKPVFSEKIRKIFPCCLLTISPKVLSIKKKSVHTWIQASKVNIFCTVKHIFNSIAELPKLRTV